MIKLSIVLDDFNGLRNDRACEAFINSIAKIRSRLLTICKHFVAAFAPILTWSSCPFEETIDQQIAIEKVIEDRLLQQWLPGYEPDLTKDGAPKKSQNKKKARNQALQKPTSKARRRR